MTSVSPPRCAGRAAVILFAMLAPVAVGAHAIHTTMTEVTSDASGVTLRIRTFADDFSASVARFAGRTVPADSSAPELDVLRYVRARFTATVGGTPAVLQPCGMRRAAELYWLCFRIPRPARAAVLIRNQMLTELHADQVNIVQLAGSGARRTMLFTARSNPAPLP
jgi:hypothetical protein